MLPPLREAPIRNTIDPRALLMTKCSNMMSKTKGNEELKDLESKVKDRKGKTYGSHGNYGNTEQVVDPHFAEVNFTDLNIFQFLGI